MTRQRSKKSYVMKPEVCAVPIYCNVKEEGGGGGTIIDSL